MVRAVYARRQLLVGRVAFSLPGRSPPRGSRSRADIVSLLLPACARNCSILCTISLSPSFKFGSSYTIWAGEPGSEITTLVRLL